MSRCEDDDGGLVACAAAFVKREVYDLESYVRGVVLVLDLPGVGVRGRVLELSGGAAMRFDLCKSRLVSARQGKRGSWCALVICSSACVTSSGESRWTRIVSRAGRSIVSLREVARALSWWL